MAEVSVAEAKRLIVRMEELQGIDAEVKPAYLERLNRSKELLEALGKLPSVDWDKVGLTTSAIDRAEVTIQQRLDLINEIEKHFRTCGLTVESEGAKRRGRKPGGEKRTRSPRRSKEQQAYDKAIADLTRDKKAELGLPARGRLSDEQKQKFNQALEREIKKRGLTAPKA